MRKYLKLLSNKIKIIKVSFNDCQPKTIDFRVSTNKNAFPVLEQSNQIKITVKQATA